MGSQHSSHQLTCSYGGKDPRAITKCCQQRSVLIQNHWPARPHLLATMPCDLVLKAGVSLMQMPAKSPQI